MEIPRFLSENFRIGTLVIIMDEIPPSIVILEDDASLRRALERLLRLSGFEAHAFASAEDKGLLEASAVAQCLILDVQLPGMSGPSFFLSLPEPRPPAVFITAFDGPRTHHALSEVGAHTLVKKPFLGKDLLAALTLVMCKKP
ncbi:response regulator [Caballeronia sp. LP003]|uniref:response regulator n=1 Tax=Caballeronia sp. LP003 TaxID=3038551 RepID=UPI00285E0225|nr:response regulator [Caballeronia sp. LP003]MDR5785216.1 response regulator [Caballeronia sp. LP003]